MTIMSVPQTLIAKEGWRAELTRARKLHRCCVCQEYINKKEQYYSIIIGGGGLGSIKFPERSHINCLDTFWAKVKRNKEGQIKW